MGHITPTWESEAPAVPSGYGADMAGNDVITYELGGDVAVLRFDDGKANALSPAVIDEIEAALDKATAEAQAVLWVGRPGRFSGGFDLGVMQSGSTQRQDLVKAGAGLLLRIYEFPMPVVIACTGHAVAAGAIALLVADRRIGATGDVKIGLIEVGIGLRLPIFGVEFARGRLSNRHFVHATMHGRVFDGDEAVDAGFLDRAVPAETVEEEALTEARTLAKLAGGAYRETKARARGAIAAEIRATLDADIGSMAGLAD